MKIKCLERFRHDRETYEEGDVRNVADDLGAYFVGNGWAEDVDGNVATGDRNASHGSTLEVQNGRIGHSTQTR